MSFLKKSAQVLTIGAAGKAIGVASTILFARWMGPTNLGSFSTFMAIAGLMATIGLLGFPILQMRDVARNAGNGPIQAFTPITVSGLAMVVLSVLGAVLLAQVLYRTNWMPALGELRAHIPLLLPLLLIGLTVPRYAGQTLIGLGFARSVTLLNQVFKPILVLGLAALWFVLGPGDHLSPNARIVMELSAALVTATVLFILLFRKVPMSFRLNRDELSRGNLEATWLSAFNFAGIDLSQVLFITTDVLVLGLFVDSEQVGVYKVAATASMLLLFPMKTMSSVYAPRIASEFANGNRRIVNKEMRRLSISTLLLVLPALLLFLLIPSWTISLLFGQSYASASNILVILTIGMMVRLALGPVGWGLTMAGHESVYLRLLLLGAGINIALNLVLVPNYSVIGAAAATCAATIFTYVSVAILERKLTRLTLSIA